MTERKTNTDTEILSELIVKGMQEKKAQHIVELNLQKIQNAVCERFIICHGTSKTQVDAIAGSVEEFVKKNTGVNAWHKEGYQNAEWILLDYVTVVVHIFRDQTRNFYNLEGLWADAVVTRVEN